MTATELSVDGVTLTTEARNLVRDVSLTARGSFRSNWSMPSLPSAEGSSSGCGSCPCGAWSTCCQPRPCSRIAGIARYGASSPAPWWGCRWLK